MSNGTTTASGSLLHASETDTCPTRQYTAISAHSSVRGTPDDIEAWLTSLPPASPANRSALPESGSERTTPATCGPQQSSASAWYDPDSACWRTFQASFLLDTLEPFSETWPRAGMMRGGVFYPQPKWEHRIEGIDSGLWPAPRKDAISNSRPNGRGGRCLSEEVLIAEGLRERGEYRWPTPNRWDAQRGPDVRDRPGSGGPNLLSAVLSTPKARDWRTGMIERVEARRDAGLPVDLNDQVGGQLNPTWVEWLMGWPIGWTDLRPLAMDKFRQWLRQFGGC